MKNKKYMEIAFETFEPLKKKYSLSVTGEGNIINYTGNQFCFSLYLERCFEFYICFHLEQENLRLLDIVQWLDFEKKDVRMLSQNQIDNQHDAKIVLGNIYKVLEKFLGILIHNPKILRDFCFEQMYRTDEYFEKSVLFSIRDAWEKREYDRFLVLIDSNRAVVQRSEKANLIFRQEAYVKKTSSTGGGSLS